LRKLLLEAAPLTVNEQQELFRRTIVEWMGTEYEQLDDILIAGIRL